jgi:hypothetical protein
MASQKIQIPSLAQLGVIRDAAPHILPPNAFSDGQNIRFVNEGVEKRKGTAKIFADTSSTNEIISISYFPDPTEDRYIRIIRDTSFNPNRIKLESVNSSGTVTELTLNTNATSFLEFINTSDSDFQTDIVAGGYALIANNGFHTPHVIESSLNTAVEIPNWNYNIATDGHVACKVIKSFKDVLIAGNLTKYGTVTTDSSGNITAITPNANITRLPSAIRISSIASPGEIPQLWDPSASGSKPADEFELSSTAPIQDILELQGTAIVYTSNSIHSIQIDSRNNVNVQNITKSQGLLSTGLVAEFEGKHLVVGSDDIYTFSGSSSSIQTVAENRIKDYFFNNLNPGYIDNCFVATDKMTAEVKIFFPNKESFSGKCNEYLAWNYKNNTWTINTCESVVDSTLGPITGGGLPSSTVTFGGVGNAAATGQPEIQKITVDLGTGNTLSAPTNQVESLSYTGSNSATYLATKATIGISDDIIPTNQEKLEYTFESQASTGGVKTQFTTVSDNQDTTIPRTQLAVDVDYDFTTTAIDAVTSKSATSFSTSSSGSNIYLWSSGITDIITSTRYDFVSNTTGLLTPANNQTIILQVIGSSFNDNTINKYKIFVNRDGVTSTAFVSSFPASFTHYNGTRIVINSVSGAGTLASNRFFQRIETALKNVTVTNGTASARYWLNADIDYFDSNVDYTLSGIRTGDSTNFSVAGVTSELINSNGTLSENVALPTSTVPNFTLSGSVVSYPVSGVGDATDLDNKPEIDLNVSVVNTILSYSPTGNNATNINLSTPSISSGVEYVEINSTQSEIRITSAFNSSDPTTFAVFRFNTPSTTPVSYVLDSADIVSGTLSFPFSTTDTNGVALTLELGNKLIRNTQEKSGFIGTYSSVSYNVTKQHTDFKLINNGSSSNPEHLEFNTAKVSANGFIEQGTLNFSQSVTLEVAGNASTSQWTATLGEAATFSFSDDNGQLISDFALTPQETNISAIATEVVTAINNLNHVSYTASSVGSVITVKNKVSASTNPVLSFIENDGFGLQKEFLTSPLSEVSSNNNFDDRIYWYVRENGGTNDQIRFQQYVGASGTTVAADIRSSSFNLPSSNVSGFVNFNDYTEIQSFGGGFPFPTTIGDFTYSFSNDLIERGALAYTVGTAPNRAFYYKVKFRSNLTAGSSTRTAPGTTFPIYNYTIDDGVNSALTSSYSPSNATDSSTTVAEGLRNSVISYFNSNKQSNQNAWNSETTVSNNNKTYGVIDLNNETTLDEFVISIATNANPDATNSAAVLTGANISGSQTGNVLRLFEPNNTTPVLDVLLSSNETTSSIAQRIVDTVNNNVQSPVNYSATNNTSSTRIDIVGSAVNTSSRWTTQYLAANNGTATDGDFFISANATVTTQGKAYAVKLNVFEPRSQTTAVLPLTQINNATIASEIVSLINSSSSVFFPNWLAEIDTGNTNVVKLTFKSNDYVLPANYPTARDVDYAGPNGYDGRAIYVSEVVYDTETIDNSAVIAEGSSGLTMATQLSQVSGVEFQRGQPDIVGTKVKLIFENQNFLSQPSALSATPAQMGLAFTDMINADVPKLNATDNADGTVTISSNDLTSNSLVFTVGFDETSDVNSIDKADRSPPENWPTASIAVTSLEQDSERPWSTSSFNDRQQYLVTASNHVTLGSNIGYAFNSCKLPSLISTGTAYDSFIERTHLTVGDFSNIKQFNYLQALVTQGDLGICVNTINSPGETVSQLRTQTKKPFHIQEEYKIDIRKPASANSEKVYSSGRLVNVCFTDLVGEFNGVQYLGKTPWRLSGYGFDFVMRESRSESKD